MMENNIVKIFQKLYSLKDNERFEIMGSMKWRTCYIEDGTVYDVHDDAELTAYILTDINGDFRKIKKEN